MSTVTVSEKLKSLALDLTREYPRSPRAVLGGHVIAARVLDKCRAILNGTGEDYNFNCPLDRIFFDASGLDANEFEALAASGASDDEMGEWIKKHSKLNTPEALVQWNNEWRFKTIDKLPMRLQLFFEDTLAHEFEQKRIIYFFDKLDCDEKRL
ncbi:MAG: DUF5069 domain-containing protein [Vampirovibrionales bacterium]|nr:DUF5069 domain-containing protein [Vampirovibrionales bacterium]